MKIKFLNGDVYVPKILGGGVITPKILGGRGNYPKDSRGIGKLYSNSPPYLALGRGYFTQLRSGEGGY